MFNIRYYRVLVYDSPEEIIREIQAKIVELFPSFDISGNGDRRCWSFLYEEERDLIMNTIRTKEVSFILEYR